MTNGWIDIKNTDMMLIMGGNPAENHPCGFKWPIEAKRRRNAKMIVVHPRCVYQLLKKQYSRYTPEMVERITGIPKDDFLKAAELFTSVRKDGDMKKVATIIYAVGWTQHTFGTQIIRSAAILQLLLGNV